MEFNQLNKPKCAVLLAAYNGMQYIEEQLKSILAQDNVEVTVFISIDQSTDETKPWLEEFAKNEKRVILLPYGQRFGGAGKNFFRLIRDVDFSNHDFIAFADQDDHWYSDKLIRACNYLINSKYDAYSSNVLAFWENGTELLVNKAQPQKKWDYLFEAAGPGCTYVMTNKLMTSVKNHLIQHWDTIHQITLHDWYCYAFARSHGYYWFIDPIPTMRYRQHTTNQVGVNSGLNAYVNRFKQIKSGWWFKQILLIAGINNISFVNKWKNLGRWDYLRLARYSSQCRRARKDSLFLMSVCILLAIKG